MNHALLFNKSTVLNEMLRKFSFLIIPKRLFWICISIICLILLCSCSPEIPSVNPEITIIKKGSTLSPRLAPSKTLTPSRTLMPTEILTATSSSPTPTITNQIDLVVKRCMQVAPSEKSLPVGGIAVLYSPITSDEDLISLLNLTTGKNFFSARIYRLYQPLPSQDSDKVIYYDLDLASHVVVNASGNQLQKLPDPDRQLIALAWIDEEQLIFLKPNWDAMAQRYDERLQLWNINSNRLVEELDLPADLYTQNSLDPWRSLLTNTSLVSPTMQILYKSSENPILLKILDVQKNHIIREFYGGFATLDLIAWAPKGDGYVIGLIPVYREGEEVYINDSNAAMDDTYGIEVYFGDRTGKLERMTWFYGKLDDQMMNPVAYSVSPGNKLVAFYLNFSPDVMKELAILDLSSGGIFRFCEKEHFVERPDVRAFPILNPLPVWDIDSDYLLFNQVKRSLDGEIVYSIRMLEVSTGMTWLVAQGETVVGWLIAPER